MVNASLYKTYKNKLNHSLRLAKRLYYEKKLQDVKSNTHATWKILNEVLHRKKSKPQLNKVLYGEAPPRGPTPYPFIYHFGRKGTPFIYLLLKKGTPFTYLL